MSDQEQTSGQHGDAQPVRWRLVALATSFGLIVTSAPYALVGLVRSRALLIGGSGFGIPWSPGVTDQRVVGTAYTLSGT